MPDTPLSELRARDIMTTTIVSVAENATVRELVALLQEMHDSPEWQEALEDNGWIDAFRTGDEFTAFLEEQDERVATTLEELGLL